MFVFAVAIYPTTTTTMMRSVTIWRYK